MKRFQIFLPEPMLEWLEEKSKHCDYSVAEIVRAIIQKEIDAKPTGRLIDLVRKARREGWYENDSGWEEVDAILAKEEKSCG